MSEWWPWALGLVSLSLLLRAEPRRNLADFLSNRSMCPDGDWPEIRVKATLEAHARITTYARERSERLRIYEANWIRANIRIAR